MPEYICHLCDYKTTRKSSYNEHLKSSKHLSKCAENCITEDCSSVSTIQSLEYSVDMKLKEMENQMQMQLKIKEMEMQMKLKEMEMEMKFKEQQMQMQMMQLQMQLGTNVIESKKDKVKPVLEKKETTLDILNNRKNAMTIEYFQEHCLNDEDINPCIQSVSIKNNDFLFPKYISYNDYSNYIPVDVICKTLQNIPVDERPIYCTDEKRKQFYIKTNNGWLKASDKELNTIIEELYWKGYRVINNAISNLIIQNGKHKNTNIYQLVYQTSNYDDKAQVGVFRILKELYPEKKDRRTHYNKLKTKLSEMTNTCYEINETDKIKADDESEIEYDNEQDEECN
jgi:hypothetical protein